MPPYPIEWLDEAKADVRRLDRPTAMRIFGCRSSVNPLVPYSDDFARSCLI